ncbi:CCR4-NOT transcription complex subunit 2 [Marchantia polymorpha subsp. ruderalis]|uniref:NOT2/NOT3/NOT5 C-terminal domain-containing protein n=2 Tax=Marchantia polymorpha TaxID=3197 RepID=A0AAF6ASJ5_MARPO|nr:hypothetical protein MARPO_0001s0449 [Marchantia polymorpha]BBM99415.1 hypothetical protein Mp_1g21150 [Marchantia polymorpha subsp. ruderalis]|eukprot:PTQ50497.1 hypothetical protein MARPO_0001s0449 [Marchantia polymorpha]
MLEHDSIMYFPFRHDANVKESMLNSSASTLLDSGSSARPFASSFSAQSASSPVFHHGVQGLHNATYNLQSVPNAMSSRNPGLGGGPSSGAHQPAGSLPSGRFGSNNLPVGLSQLSHGAIHGHSAMTSRAGISVVGNHAFSSSMNGVGGSGPGAAPGAGSVSNRGAMAGLGVSPSQMGVAGPRIASSAGNIGAGAGVSLTGGGNLSRSLNSGGGLSVTSLNGSRVNMGPLSNSGGIGVQGPGRPVNSMLPQGVNISSSTYSPSGDLLAMISRAPQAVSLLGSNFSSSPGSGIQVPSANGQLGTIGLGNDGGTNDGVAFDMNDFPQLTTRQTSGGGLQGPVAALRKQGVAVNTIVQQNQEFSIQNEDFPALPGFKGGSSDMPTEMQHKDQQHENTLSAMQAQHFPTGRSAGFSLGGSYVPHRQQQQQHQGTGVSSGVSTGSLSGTNAADLPHLHAAAQAVGTPASGTAQSLRSGGSSGVAVNMGSYDQLVHQYQQHQQSQFSRLGAHQQQLTAVGQSSRDIGGKSVQGIQATPDRFGLLGLLSVIRMSDPDLTTLALGTDLTTLGLNLNSRENLYKTFASPWADGPIRGEPEFTLPQCYNQAAPKLQSGYYAKFQQDTLFYIFYSMPNDEAQLYAADELVNRGWFYHKDHHMWFTRVPNVEPLVKTNTYERGSYYYFDQNTWETGRKENFVLHYEMLEKRPQLPSQH